MKALAVFCTALVATACFAQAPDVAGLYDVTTDGSSSKVKAGEKGKLVIAFKTSAYEKVFNNPRRFKSLTSLIIDILLPTFETKWEVLLKNIAVIEYQD